MPFFYYDPGYIFLIPAIILAFYAQIKVSSAYSRYRKKSNMNGITGAEAARIILDSNGLADVPVEITGGRLSDHYDPGAGVMRLSREVYSSASIAAVGIAAHESGHAIQDKEGYFLLRMRNGLVPVVNIVSNLAWPLLVIGLLMGAGARSAMGTFIFNIGIIFFLAVIIFHAVTLPVEINASRRAMVQLKAAGIISSEEAPGVRKVLSAAALTYIAALAMAVANLLRMLALRGDDE